MSPRRDSRFWLIPALTFLVGLVLGGVFIGVGTIGGSEDAPEAAPTPSASPTGTPTEEDVTVTVPAECVNAAELSQEVLALARQAAEAIGGLDARQLQEIVGEMQQLQPQVSESASACREAAGEASIS